MTALVSGSRAVQSFHSKANLTNSDIKELIQQTRYSWTIQTWKTPLYVCASFAGSKKRAVRITYDNSLDFSANHLKAAITFVQSLAERNGAVTYALASQGSTEEGYIFTFVN